MLLDSERERKREGKKKRGKEERRGKEEEEKLKGTARRQAVAWLQAVSDGGMERRGGEKTRTKRRKGRHGDRRWLGGKRLAMCTSSWSFRSRYFSFSLSHFFFLMQPANHIVLLSRFSVFVSFFNCYGRYSG
eukprot:TRINITY_DN14828_c1_g1_i1.p1 TRINITY_DN14828_c1_g1~~TRINITY_DN14828_c1_g1_i1.p1  ORF type:complete len:132 (-),score=32.48 TRINITY_DN14828_c1_g1_i1:1450-1845(-)